MMGFVANQVEDLERQIEQLEAEVAELKGNPSPIDETIAGRAIQLVRECVAWFESDNGKPARDNIAPDLPRRLYQLVLDIDLPAYGKKAA